MWFEQITCFYQLLFIYGFLLIQQRFKISKTKMLKKMFFRHAELMEAVRTSHLETTTDQE